MRVHGIVLAFCFGLAVWAEPPTLDTAEWDTQYTFRYTYELSDAHGFARQREPIEITLSAPDGLPSGWENDIRVVRMATAQRGVLVPHQVLGKTAAVHAPTENGETPAPAQSVNVVFFTDCPARGTVTYKLFWGPPKDGAKRPDFPAAADANGLRMSGEAPRLTIENEHYRVQLDPKSGAILTARLADRPESENLFYGKIPIHFGVDVWSPPQGWDHDYDWKSPPNQRVDAGPLVVRYHRWGPLQNYRDVNVSISYTFYAHTPYVHFASTMHFTENRSVRAVRMGEIVVAHSHKALPNEKDADGKSPNLLSHYAWPAVDGTTQIVEVDAHRDGEGAATLPGVVSGALGILDRDVPWVAGYIATGDYGIATLRKSQFAGNLIGGPVPQSAPCTYVSNYGWGFTYWSRPMVYPPGAKGTPEDQNTAIAAGTIFGIDEALLFFQPDEALSEVRDNYERFTHPLHHVFIGTGPW